ncbi:MAG: formylmethanofuran--tetrahydromethanopterin N-formyltransferase [Planctomycetota bacterium]|nr:formylmethanofuran--tetrahydromethanopterin N-formyltransferase [Planctomycetota bacterium]MDA1137781.1 formylmethanofuran--tetrahydromethanopterin N-formyltransferase [Planctomycetota bacterium]
MTINGVEIQDTYAEAFGMTGARCIVTAANERWAKIAGETASGYATSVISCDAEVGIESVLSAEETPDNRPGVSLLFFAFNTKSLEKAVANRIGQCIMTCPTTACYDGLPGSENTIAVGGALRYFGDGFQFSKLIAGRRYWRLPVMDGEFTCEERVGTAKGVAGGNFLILGETQAAALTAAEKAVEAMNNVSGIIMPFPGGIVRSGSKVGSKYKKLVASTNDAYCPTLRGLVPTELPEGVNAVYEIVIDGLTLGAVEEATRVGIRAACTEGVVRISAGNYGGKLGKYLIKLRHVMSKE